MKRLMALALCLGFLLCGCGTDTPSYTPTGDGLTPEQAETEPVETTPATTAPYTLVYDTGDSFNPFESNSLTNRALFSQIGRAHV